MNSPRQGLMNLKVNSAQIKIWPILLYIPADFSADSWLIPTSSAAI